MIAGLDGSLSQRYRCGGEEGRGRGWEGGEGWRVGGMEGRGGRRVEEMVGPTSAYDRWVRWKSQSEIRCGREEERAGGWEEGRAGGWEEGRGGGGGGWRDQHLVDLSWRFGSSEGGGWEAEEEGEERRRVTNMYVVLSSRSRERPSLMS